MLVISGSIECIDNDESLCNICSKETNPQKREIYWAFGKDFVSRWATVCDFCTTTHGRTVTDSHRLAPATVVSRPLVQLVTAPVLPTCTSCGCRASPVLSGFGLLTSTCLACTDLDTDEVHSRCALCNVMEPVAAANVIDHVYVCTDCRRPATGDVSEKWHACKGGIDMPCTKRAAYCSPTSCGPVTCKEHHFVDVHVWYRVLCCTHDGVQSRCCFGNRRAMFPTRCSLCLQDEDVDLTDTHRYIQEEFLRNTGHELIFERNPSQWRIATRPVENSPLVNLVVLGRPSIPVPNLVKVYISEQVNCLIFLDPYDAPVASRLPKPDRRDNVQKHLEKLLDLNRSFHRSVPRVYYIGRKQVRGSNFQITGPRFYEFFEGDSGRKRKAPS